MTQFLRSLLGASLSNLSTPGAITADGDSAAYLDTTAYDGSAAVVFTSAAASAGTTPTLDVTVVHCDTAGGTYTAVPGVSAFTRVTDGGASQEVRAVDLSKCKQFLKVHFDIGGTSSPSFTCAAVVLAMPKGS